MKCMVTPLPHPFTGKDGMACRRHKASINTLLYDAYHYL